MYKIELIESLLFCAVDNALDGEGLNDADNYPGFWEGRVMNNISFKRRGFCFRRAIKVSWLKLGIWTNGGPGRSSSQTFHECTCFFVCNTLMYDDPNTL